MEVCRVEDSCLFHLDFKICDVKRQLISALKESLLPLHSTVGHASHYDSSADGVDEGNSLLYVLSVGFSGDSQIGWKYC